MRNILFRGKRLDNGEWEYGFIVKMFGAYHIIDKDDENTAYEVIQETVGQYTGLNDKNGKRIFEGDILCFDETVFVCYWDGGNIEFGLRNNEESIGMAYVAVYDAEIIGNVHDNKLEDFDNGR